MNTSTTLYFKQGGSDKVYQVSLVPQGDGFVVNFAYGRRGATLTTGTKTQQPGTLAEATKSYEKLINEKKAKGYTEGESGTVYIGTSSEERSTGIVPQLLNAIEEGTAQTLVENSFYGAQEKFDGKRMLIRATPRDGVEAINRKGLRCGMPESVHRSLEEIHEQQGGFVIDGEAVGELFYAFDMLQTRGLDITGKPYSSRHASLASLVGIVGIGVGRTLLLASLAVGTIEKRALLDRLRREGKEGIVFKHLDAPYTPSRPSSGGTQFKYKFTASATVRVDKINAKRSFSMTMRRGSGNMVVVGNCTVPPNHKLPSVGDLVEVRYLYAYRGGSLFQPVYAGQRDDIEQPDRYDTLKFKTSDTGE